MTTTLACSATKAATALKRPARSPRPDGRHRDPELPLVIHALGLKLAIELDELDRARAELDALSAATAAAEITIGDLEVKAQARARAEARVAAANDEATS